MVPVSCYVLVRTLVIAQQVVQFDLPTTHRSTSTTTGICLVLTAQQEVNNGGYLSI